MNKLPSGLLVYRKIMSWAERLTSKFHSCPQGFTLRSTVVFSENISALGISSNIPAAERGLFTQYPHQTPDMEHQFFFKKERF